MTTNEKIACTGDKLMCSSWLECPSDGQGRCKDGFVTRPACQGRGGTPTCCDEKFIETRYPETGEPFKEAEFHRQLAAALVKVIEEEG